mmetsp:Transcript_13407/g.21906  ORF Transcript_13407/g.21906 Transcript_13407/m.21906 type:complete len:352 (-) Transcript_13407:1179-2234(-)
MSELFKYAFEGGLVVRDSATVLCIRRRGQGGDGGGLSKDRARKEPFVSYFKGKYAQDGIDEVGVLKSYLGEANESMCFETDWEILMGQNEVINYVRSSEEKLVCMRYPGEFKIAGGHVEDNESMVLAAKRELHEEFIQHSGLSVGLEEITVRPFSIEQTKPVRGVSHLMYNFVALEDENPWLEELDLSSTNRSLKEKRERFMDMISGKESAFWDMPRMEREKYSPEVKQISWVPIQTALENCLTTLLPGQVYVNGWQREELANIGRAHRDPMLVTASLVSELEMFLSSTSLKAYCESIDLDKLLPAEQYLFPGMTTEEAQDALRKKFQEPKMLLKAIAEEREKHRATEITK